MTFDQQLRHEILLQLKGAGELGLSSARIHRVAQRSGLDCTHEAVKAGLFFLVSNRFATKLQDAATGATTWQITGPGLMHFENEG